MNKWKRIGWTRKGNSKWRKSPNTTAFMSIYLALHTFCQESLLILRWSGTPTFQLLSWFRWLHWQFIQISISVCSVGGPIRPSVLRKHTETHPCEKSTRSHIWCKEETCSKSSKKNEQLTNANEPADLSILLSLWILISRMVTHCGR